MRQRGALMFELLVGGLIALVLGGGIMALMQGTYASRKAVMGQNASAAAARQPIDTLADHVRNAFLNSNANWTAISAATETSVTYYVDSAGTTVRYYVSNGALRRVDSSGDTVKLTGISSFSFTYYKSVQYNAAAVFPTDNPHAPTTAELPYLTAIQIAATVEIDGFQSYYETVVRLRNSPRKTSL
jgi:hypothetical protein